MAKVLAVVKEHLTPVGDPPERHARWCPRCVRWILHTEFRAHRWQLCPICCCALVRQARHERSVPGEIRPGVKPEWDDPPQPLRAHDIDWGAGASVTIVTNRVTGARTTFRRK